jgi:hypothetical protein
MSIPIDRDNTGSVNINNINNEPMLKIVNKGNGKVDLNSASDKNALSIDANGVVSASDLTATNLTTSNLTLLQPNLNIPANATISGTTTLNGTLAANSTADIADTLTLSKVGGTGLDVNAGVDIKGGLIISGSTHRGSFTLNGAGSQNIPVTAGILTNDSVILMNIQGGAPNGAGGVAGVNISEIDPNNNQFVVKNVSSCVDIFNYVIIN